MVRLPTEFPAKRFRHVSSVALDFMRRLLVKDPNRRITLSDALMHPFITGASTALTTPEPSAPPPPPSKLQIVNSLQGPQILVPDFLKANSVGIMNSLRLFASFPMLTKIILEVIAYTITAEQISDFRAEFLALDSDSSGTINMQELQALAVVGNALLQGSGEGSPTQFDNLDQLMGGIINPRRLRHVSHTNTVHCSANESTTMDEDSDGGGLSLAMGKTDLPSVDSSMSSSPPSSFGTTESCSSLYTNPSSRSLLPPTSQQGGQHQSLDMPSSTIRTLRPGGSSSSSSSSGESSLHAITYSEFIAAAMCGRMDIEDERVAVAFDLLDAGRQGALTAEAVTTFLGKDIDTSILHNDILLTKAQVHLQVELSREMFDGGEGQQDHHAAGIDQDTFFKAWRVAGFGQGQEEEGGDMHMSSMMSTDSTANDQGL